jgi:hypothetical protein
MEMFTFKLIPSNLFQFLICWWEGLCSATIIAVAFVSLFQIFLFFENEVKKFRNVLQLASINAVLKGIQDKLDDLEPINIPEGLGIYIFFCSLMSI